MRQKFFTHNIPNGIERRKVMWADERIFYHIYPLGFCGAPEKNKFDGSIQNEIYKISEQIEHIKNLGANAIYLGPIFESTAHGYDTADYYKIDARLGSSDDFADVCKKLHENDIKIVLDGVFNHVGRDFWAFKDVQNKKGYSMYADWFYINWGGNNCYNDGFSYDNWEGCNDLIKLNLKNPYVKEHIFNAIRFWVEKFDIDGLRLDVAYCLDKDFLCELRHFCKYLKHDFWLMGETLHGDYNQWMNPDMLDSVTNYECYKGLYSSFNSKNLFEIAHSISRQERLYAGKHMYTFIDNHDVSRIATNMSDKRDLKLIYTLLFAMPGVPSIYYDSEFGIQGDKKHGDKTLRPACTFHEYTDLTHHVKNLCNIYHQHKAFCYGTYKELLLENETFCFMRELNEECLICAINISDFSKKVNCLGMQLEMPPKSAAIYVNGECLSFERAEQHCVAC